MSEAEIETLEEQQSELKRCLSRLSFVGMGLSNDLDQSLKNLRNAVKNNEEVDAIKAEVDNIGKFLLTLEDTKDKKQSTDIQIQKSFSEFLDDKRLPLALKKLLSEKKQVDKNSDLVEITQSTIDVIFNYLSEQKQIQKTVPQAEEKLQKNKVGSLVVEKSDSKTEKKGGFFSRLFGFGKSSDENLLTDESIAALSSKFDEETIPDELKESLQQLIDQLSAMENYNEVALQLNEKIVGLHSLNELIDILELMTGAFAEISSNEHQELEKFLKSLSQRIDRVNGFVNTTIAFSEQVTEDTRVLDEGLQDSVSDIKDKMSGSNNLAEIKNHLEIKMNGIIDAVNQFKSQQENNQRKLNQDIVSLKEQLDSTHDESARLREELAAQRVRAQTDPLTRLPNRYSYNERLTQEYNRWRRYRSPLSLVIGDIDFFKKTNDVYGHAAGDEVLKSVASFLQESLRESDFIARFGGEEFVILLPETSLIDATKAMNKIRLGIKKLTVNFKGKDIETAMSFGISEFENGDTPKVVFARADKALYRAKEKGRDQVCCQRATTSNDSIQD